MKKLMVILILLPILIVQTADAKPKAKPKDTPPYDIVSEYIRSLSAVHKIQQSAIKETKNESDDHMKSMMNAIRTISIYKNKVKLFDESPPDVKGVRKPNSKTGC